MDGEWLHVVCICGKFGDGKSTGEWESVGGQRSHKGDHALVGKRLTERLPNLGQKKMPVGLKSASVGAVPQGAVLQEQQAQAWVPLHGAALEASQTKGALFGVKIRPVLYHL